ncbi:polysaccharide deacetylase [Arthrobacter sp. CAN_C5]|uniref:polysaccharide deacetylase family protein n=1 Tax=Arthrobacter sp. CAN_C5 TaxID=2760706 RepID=UPI001AE8A68A|nr:polysaccharide deacetylase [Arthrobacter sp. CAN_C5]MBP2216939.1 peptidoglycan/xylan/chitin deacetylase (PgdA/CDA1 family) [Arthrobacter sp. CAN_C5]
MTAEPMEHNDNRTRPAPAWTPGPSDWRQGASAVFTMTFDVDAETPILGSGKSYADNLMVMSHQSYGPDVGVPRILNMLDELDIQATFFIPGWVAEHRAGLAPTIIERGHEVAHHSYSHQAPTSMTMTEERDDFERALAVFDAQGIAVTGYRAANWCASWRTPALVAEYGLTYDSSLMGDDRPYTISTPAGRLVELPVHWSLDDWEQYAFLPAPDIGSIIQSPARAVEVWRAELDGMRHFGGLFNLCAHPFLSGRPGRLLALRGLIEYAQDCGDVTFATCAATAELVLKDEHTAERTLTKLSDAALESFPG